MAAPENPLTAMLNSLPVYKVEPEQRVQNIKLEEKGAELIPLRGGKDVPMGGLPTLPNFLTQAASQLLKTDYSSRPLKDILEVILPCAERKTKTSLTHSFEPVIAEYPDGHREIVVLRKRKQEINANTSNTGSFVPTVGKVSIEHEIPVLESVVEA